MDAVRFGLVRDAEGLPEPEVQVRGFERVGVDQLLSETLRQDGQRRLRKWITTLRRGDTIVAFGLNAFNLSTGELAVLLRTLCEAGVTVELLDAGLRPQRIEPTPSVPRILALLAEHEQQMPPSRRQRAAPHTRSGRGGKPLSRYQIDYATKLLRRGTPLRELGLLFQMAPDDIWAVLQVGQRLAGRLGDRPTDVGLDRGPDGGAW